MKLLYDTISETLRPYPRSDDEPVVGLDPSLLIMDIIEQEMPMIKSGQVLRPTQSINVIARQVIRGWEVFTPPAQWSNTQAFMAAFSDEEKAQIALSTDPIIAGMRLTLSTWLDVMEPDDSRVQAGLNQLVTLGILTEERKAEIITTATAS